MAKIPDIRKMQQIMENSHLQIIEAEREILLREASGLFCPYSNRGKMLENWKFDNRY